MASAASASPPWADLPPDLLADISARLHAASDNVRFHAVCRAWRVAGDQPSCPLPWLLAPSSAADDSAEDQLCRCVFSKATYRAPGICVRNRRVAYANGTAAWLVRDKGEICLVNPLSAARLAFPGAGGEWLDHRHRIVSDDGGVLLCDMDPNYHDPIPNIPRFRASFLLPGHRKWQRVSSDLESGICCAAACYRGGYVVCVDDLGNCHILRPRWEMQAALPDEPAVKERHWSYLLTTHRGELLLASVLRDYGGYLSVSLHELRLTSSTGHNHNGSEQQALEVEWVRRDESDSDMAWLDDHVLFLGFPASFAVEAARFGGELRGGAAYFVDDGWEGKPCRVCRYSFRDGRVGRVATLVDTLPAGWHDTNCMWFLPDPQISAACSQSAASSGELLQGYNSSGAQRRQQLTIYARNLSPKMDSSRLRETFSVYGKVAGARVAYDTRGGWSREFGFVTMATQEGYDKAMAALNRPKAVKKAPAVDDSVTMLEWFLVLLLLLFIFALVYVLQRLARYGFSVFRNGVARLLM
ncbi:unnamed protein product [Urochloa decumbens]|uniref:RRM domain-containing protein n=1 Tax=Urochloa decumbens TaxID=240449 RepID=A0ABC8W6R7_9POAL